MTIEDLFVFEDDIRPEGVVSGIKASLKWDSSKYVVIVLVWNNSAKSAAIGSLMQRYFEGIVAHIQARK